MKIGVNVSGVSELLAVLKQLPPAIEQKVLAAAVSVPARKMAKAARGFIETATRGKGTLAKSIDFSTRRMASKGLVMSLVGARRGASAINEQGVKVNATRYAHLIEYGHAKRNGAGTVAARPWLRPAITQAQFFITNDIANGLQLGMAAELRKLVKKNNKQGVKLV
tara:strand:+ start:3056 stop:3553 length:498 start_codon:yes stop_codon:yes gene_type:complete